jgi:hypothetical protein
VAEETIEGRRRSSDVNIGGSSNDKLKWHRRNQPVQEFVINNFALDRKIKEACKGVMPETQWLIKREIESDQDKELVADFILQWSDHGKGGDGGTILYVSETQLKWYFTVYSNRKDNTYHISKGTSMVVQKQGDKWKRGSDVVEEQKRGAWLTDV